MKKTIVILLLCFIFLSCNSSDDNIVVNKDGSTLIATSLWFKVSSPTEMDLLNPNNIGAYLEDEIKIFYLRNGNVIEINDSNMDSPRNFSIVTPADSGGDFYAFSVGLNAYYESDDITYIEWNELDTDTIRANFRVGENYRILSKAWFNEALIYDENVETISIPEIIKE